MLRRQAYRFELIPNGEQIRNMRRFAGACRFVYNKALALEQENHKTGNKYIGYFAMSKHLTAWRNSPDMAWLKLSPRQSVQCALIALDQAYKNFFAKRAGFPRFKKKGNDNSFCYPSRKRIKFDQVNSRIYLSKLGWLRYRNSREVLGEVRQVTVSQSGDKWFVSIVTLREVEQPLPTSTSAIGIDVGIARFATMSDSSYLEPLNSLKKHLKRLGYYQRRVSRKVKFSNNWKKESARVRKIHTHIANARRDYLHKASTTISKNHALVCVEDLQVCNMVRSAAGNIDNPGRRVKAKSALNRSILDQGWGEFRRQLGYKLAWNGGMLISVPPQNTSRTCPSCGLISKENRRTQEKFLCIGCNYENHADVVGAINILERGNRFLACGESAQSGCSVKQEPTEVTRLRTY